MTSSQKRRPLYLVLFGPPGTGKGTQAKLISERLGVEHISTGDVMREEASSGSELGMLLKSYMDKGELVPDEVTVGLLEQRLQRPDAQRGVLFDGYPRTLAQAGALDEALERLGKPLDLALLIRASDDEIIRRLSGRWLCRNCGAIYQDSSRAPKQAGVCDACGERQLYQRDDDRPEVARQRLDKQRPPAELTEHYRAQGKLAEIEGEQPVAAVTRDLLAVIEKRIANRSQAQGSRA